MLIRRHLLAVALFALAVTAAPAQQPPAEYNVKIRYQINVFRNERIVQFREMVKALESAGFKKAPGPDDEEINYERVLMTGTIGSPAAARSLLGERHVHTVMIVPKMAQMPGENDPVRVHLELRGALTPEQQKLYSGETEGTRDALAALTATLDRLRVIAENARVVLRELGFREAAGYDDRGHTRLVGQIPFGKLDGLLEDLRKHPKAPAVGAPFASRWPLAFIEVLPETAFPKERPLPTPLPKGQETITPELRAVIADEAEAAKPRRMEVILARTPGDTDRNWSRLLLAGTSGMAVEGRHGSAVTVFGPAREAVVLAEKPAVSTVRLPRSGQPRQPLPAAPPADPKDQLKAIGVERLHLLARNGKDHRVVIIDGDFRGLRERLGKELSAKTKVIDLTAEKNRDVKPEPFPGDPKEVGHGTQTALLAAKYVPDAQLILIRIDPESPYQLQMVADAIKGATAQSVSLDTRREELAEEGTVLESRGLKLSSERKRLLDNAPPRDFDELWANYLKRQAQHNKEEVEFHARFERWYALLGALQDLRGAHVVVSPMVWFEGQPLDGGGGILSRWFDARPFGASLWLHAPDDTRGQSWEGLFRDVDGNGVMEFSAPGNRLNKDRWSHELNFLAWQPTDKPKTLDIPANTTIRVSIQWREPHDPEFWKAGDDAYRVPLAHLQLMLLKQTDPTGKKQPADDLEVVGESFGLPQRLDNQPNSATYEQTLEVPIKEAGRYVLRVEGQVPRGIRPAGEPTLPALEKYWELKPRVFVQTLSGAGRAVFADHATAPEVNPALPTEKDLR